MVIDRYINQVLVKIKAIDQNGVCDEDNVIAIIALIRQHLEANNQKELFKITSFYCNWSLHPKLDRSQTIENILNRIDEVLLEDNQTIFNDRINEIISIKILRKELLEIIGPVDTELLLFKSYSGWKIFLKILLDILITKPIIRTKGKNTSRYVSEMVLEKPDISTIDKTYLYDFGITEQSVMWKLLVKPIGYYVIGPLVMTETQEDFEQI